MKPIHWLPPLAWMGVIVVLSTDVGSYEHTGRFLLPLFQWLLPSATPLQLDAVHALTRKAAHITEYAILTFLWFRALAGGARWSSRVAGWTALAAGLAWACLDEAHQMFVLSRTPSAGDVALDGMGAMAAVLVARAGWQRAAEATTSVLLGVAVVGGAVLLALGAVGGVSSALLWVTTPAAGALLAFRYFKRARSVSTP
jgi:VanZ family protein